MITWAEAAFLRACTGETPVPPIDCETAEIRTAGLERARNGRWALPVAYTLQLAAQAQATLFLDQPFQAELLDPVADLP